VEKIGSKSEENKVFKKGVDGYRYRTGADSGLAPVRFGNFYK
jgi:hypothetical protein